MAPLAILAGGGRLPLLIAESVASRGGAVHIVAIRGEAGPDVERHPHSWVNWGHIGRMLRVIKSHGGGNLVIAGHVARPDVMSFRPDLGLFRNVPAIARILRSGGDNDVLTRVIAFFEQQGVTVKGVHEVAPELLALATPMAPVPPPGIAGDIAIGARVLTALADLDVGQAIVVADGHVVAIEGVDGTGRMLARLATSTLHNASGRRGVLVKAPKAGQELRVDMPAIGPETVSDTAAAGLTAIAIAAGQVLILDRAELELRSHDSCVALYILPLGIERREAIETKVFHLRQCGRVMPTPADMADIRTGVETTGRLVPFNTGAATAVVRGHVLAIAAAETFLAFAARVTQLRQWGSMRLPSPRGALVVRSGSAAGPLEINALLPHIMEANLAGIAIVQTGDQAHAIPASAIADADTAGRFIVEARPPLFSRVGRP